MYFQSSTHKKSDFVNHLYDYRPNWTPLGPITIINHVLTAQTHGNLESICSLVFGAYLSIKELQIELKIPF